MGAPDLRRVANPLEGADEESAFWKHAEIAVIPVAIARSGDKSPVVVLAHNV